MFQGFPAFLFASTVKDGIIHVCVLFSTKKIRSNSARGFRKPLWAKLLHLFSHSAPGKSAAPVLSADLCVSALQSPDGSLTVSPEKNNFINTLKAA